jgi:hypothetical protein
MEECPSADRRASTPGEAVTVRLLAGVPSTCPSSLTRRKTINCTQPMAVDWPAPLTIWNSRRRGCKRTCMHPMKPAASYSVAQKTNGSSPGRSSTGEYPVISAPQQRARPPPTRASVSPHQRRGGTLVRTCRTAGQPLLRHRLLGERRRRRLLHQRDEFLELGRAGSRGFRAVSGGVGAEEHPGRRDASAHAPEDQAALATADPSAAHHALPHPPPA